MPNWIPFLVILLVSTLTPGPNNILSMSRAAQVGFKKSFRMNLGMFAGFVVVIGSIAIFDHFLVSALPLLKPILQYAGAAYILWLAWSIAFGSSKKAAAQTNAGSFLTGFAMQFINPKVIIFGLTMISTFVTPYYSSAAALAGFTLLISFMGFTATCCWGLFGSVFSKLFIEHEKVMNRILAVLLAGSAISLFFE
jgi:cysteine/O-acetylserine efflux protein